MAKGETTAPTGQKFPIAYEVTNVEPWTFLDDRGNPVPGYKVTFVYEGGFVDWVDIAAKVYGAETVKVAIERKITEHVKVLTLGA